MSIRPLTLPPLPQGEPVGEIPKVVHQLWIGGGDSTRARAVARVWEKALPDFEVRFWDDQALAGTPLQKYVDLVEPVTDDYRLKADLYRLAVVAYYGGIYADSDAIPLHSLDHLVGHRRGWVGSGPETEKSPTLINAHFGMPKGHPFLSLVMELALDALKRGVTNPHWVAGPRQFRTAYTMAPSLIDTYWNFVTTVEGEDRAMVRGNKPLDLDRLREKYPDSPILHVVLR